MNWLSIHFYPNEVQDVFLTEALKPFLVQQIWPQKDSCAFFIRYQDEKGPHIRLRVKGETTWLEEHVKPSVKDWFDGRGEWREVEYVREPERFGGEAAMVLAEEYFQLSTRVVLDRISRVQFTYGDAMFDALRLHIMTAFGAGFTRDRARWYFEQLQRQWLPLFFAADDDVLTIEITGAFDKTFAPQKEKIAATMDGFWLAIENENFDAKQPEWLEWLQGNRLILKGFEEDLEKALPSLIHLTNNRLGINNQDEVYLNYILSKTL